MGEFLKFLSVRFFYRPQIILMFMPFSCHSFFGKYPAFLKKPFIMLILYTVCTSHLFQSISSFLLMSLNSLWHRQWLVSQTILG